MKMHRILAEAASAIAKSVFREHRVLDHALAEAFEANPKWGKRDRGFIAETVFEVARWRRVLATVPLIGALWHWSGVAELARLLAILLEQDVPLPEALQLASTGVRDANLRELSGQLAQSVQQGRSLTELLATTHRLPASLGPLLGWGERSGQLAEALRVAGDMFEGRVRLRAELLRSILPFVVFVGIAMVALFSLVALYAPMLSLLQGLS